MLTFIKRFTDLVVEILRGTKAESSAPVTASFTTPSTAAEPAAAATTSTVMSSYTTSQAITQESAATTKATTTSTSSGKPDEVVDLCSEEDGLKKIENATPVSSVGCSKVFIMKGKHLHSRS